MSAWLESVPWLDAARAALIVRVVVLAVVGLVLSRVAARLAGRVLKDRLTPTGAQVGRRVAAWLVLGIFAVSVLRELGFQLSVVLGAAGVLSVALGFAAQTSASNLVSGLFLLFERSFGVGDVVEIDGTTGEVLAIDLLSVRLRTFDNIQVRVPNETVVKAKIKTLSAFPVRRCDLAFQVAYKEDLARVRDLLMQIADRNPLCLEEPPPLWIVTAFADSGISVQFSVWAARENFLIVRNALYDEIKRGFDEARIEIPFPQRVLVAAAGAPAIRVRVEGAEP